MPDTHAPRRKFPPLKIVVNIYDAASDKLESTKRLDYSDKNKREWLFKVQIWAWHNSKIVEILNVKDEKL